MASPRRRKGKEPIAEYGDPPALAFLPLPPLPPLLPPHELGGRASKRQKLKPGEVKLVRLTAATVAPNSGNRNDRWLMESHKWATVSTVEEADAALHRQLYASGRQPQLRLTDHVQLGDAALQPYSGFPMVCGIRAYEAAGVLKDNNGRLYMHSADLAAAEAVPIYGRIAEQVFIGSALDVERQQPGYEVVDVQIIMNEPSVSGLHRDSGGGAGGGDDGASVCKGPASMRAIARASALLDPQQAQAQGLGGLGFSASSIGAGGGATIDLTGRTLFATKFALGKDSDYFHQVQVKRRGIASGLYALEPKPQGPVQRKGKRTGHFEQRMAEARAGAWQLQPLGDPPADVVRDLESGVIEARTTGGEMERLHSYSAAGKVGGAASMAKEGLTETGESKRASNMGKAAWEQKPERMLEITREASKKAVKKKAGAQADPAAHGAKNAKRNTCRACIFMFRSTAQDEEELEELVRESQMGKFPCQGWCDGHPFQHDLPGGRKSRQGRWLEEGKVCDAVAEDFILNQPLAKKKDNSGRQKQPEVPADAAPSLPRNAPFGVSEWKAQYMAHFDRKRVANLVPVKNDGLAVKLSMAQLHEKVLAAGGLNELDAQRSVEQVGAGWEGVATVMGLPGQGTAICAAYDKYVRPLLVDSDSE